jgi:hypothetical protein
MDVFDCARWILHRLISGVLRDKEQSRACVETLAKSNQATSGHVAAQYLGRKRLVASVAARYRYRYCANGAWLDLDGLRYFRLLIFVIGHRRSEIAQSSSGFD